MDVSESLYSALNALPQDPVLHWRGHRFNSADGPAHYAVHTPEIALAKCAWAWMLVEEAHSDFEVWTEQDPRPSQVIRVEPDFDLWVVNDISPDQLQSDRPCASVTSIATWSSDLVSHTLSMWVCTVIGREDVQFAMDNSHPRQQSDQTPSSYAAEPKDDMYRISDTLGVSGRVFSELLSLPHEQAALLTRELGYLTSEVGYGALHWSD